MDPKSKFVVAKVPQIDGSNFLMNPADLKDILPVGEIVVKRVYWIASPKSDNFTGEHAHKDAEDEIFIVLSGTGIAIIDDDASGKKEIPINSNNIMWVPRMVWHGFQNLSSDFVMMALTTTNYDADRKGYVTDYNEFEKLKNGIK